MAAASRRARITAALLGAIAAVAGVAAPAGAFELGTDAMDDLVSRVSAGATTATTAPTSPDERCRPAPGTPVADMVGQIFRCRLAGFAPPADVRHIAAEAVVVAQCESRFDPNAIVFGGAYVDRRHPMTGMFYTAAGVFQFIRTTGDKYIRGGYANATDPVANINAAVDLYLDNRNNGRRGWLDWECSAVNGAFKSSSVLPGWPGGPATLPDWAWQH